MVAPSGRAALPFLLVGLLGCGKEGTAGRGGPVTRDSAGIAIVASDAPAWAEGKGWTIAEAPTTDIVGGGTPETDLSQINGAVRLADGRVVVSSGLSNAVRFYDPQGKLTASVGRPGAGPGEFQGIAGLWRTSGDSVIASDMMLQRLSVISPGAEFARAFSLGGQGGLSAPTGGQFGLAVPMGRLADGAVLGLRMSFRLQAGDGGTYRDTVALVRYAPDGTTRDTVGVFPGLEMTQVPMTFNGQTVSTPSPVPLGKQTVIGVGEDRLFVAQNNAWEVEVRSPAGTIERLIRLAVPEAPITEADVAAHKQEQIELMEAAPQMRSIPEQLKKQFLDRVNNAKYPSTLPWISTLLPVSDGTLWVEETSKPGATQRRYAVFDREGTFLGRVLAPAGLRVTAAYPDAVLGIWKDADDVEHVRLHAIAK